jgi:hypothetical protein
MFKTLNGHSLSCVMIFWSSKGIENVLNLLDRKLNSGVFTSVLSYSIGSTYINRIMKHISVVFNTFFNMVISTRIDRLELFYSKRFFEWIQILFEVMNFT